MRAAFRLLTTDEMPLSGLCTRGYFGSHLQRTGETMAPSFFNSAKALSTSLRSAPNAFVMSPAETGLPASRMAFKTWSFIIMGGYITSWR